MQIENEINNNINIEENKNVFLNTLIGQTINNAINIGLKSILPDLIENQIIEIKDSLLSNGLKSGIDTAVDTAINFGKSAAGIITGNFENMSQIRTAVGSGGIVDTLSDVIDIAVNKIYELGYIDKSVSKIIKNGKNVLLNNITSNINTELENQTNAIEKLEKYVENWKEYYIRKDFSGMTKEYNKIKTQLENVLPLENILKETRAVETLHNLIKNNGRNFEITEQQKLLVEKLS